MLDTCNSSDCNNINNWKVKTPTELIQQLEKLSVGCQGCLTNAFSKCKTDSCSTQCKDETSHECVSCIKKCAMDSCDCKSKAVEKEIFLGVGISLLVIGLIFGIYFSLKLTETLSKIGFGIAVVGFIVGIILIILYFTTSDYYCPSPDSRCSSHGCCRKPPPPPPPGPSPPPPPPPGPSPPPPPPGLPPGPLCTGVIDPQGKIKQGVNGGQQCSGGLYCPYGTHLYGSTGCKDDYAGVCTLTEANPTKPNCTYWGGGAVPYPGPTETTSKSISADPSGGFALCGLAGNFEGLQPYSDGSACKYEGTNSAYKNTACAIIGNDSLPRCFCEGSGADNDTCLSANKKEGTGYCRNGLCNTCNPSYGYGPKWNNTCVCKAGTSRAGSNFRMPCEFNPTICCGTVGP